MTTTTVYHPPAAPAPAGRRRRGGMFWAGWVLTGLLAAFLAVGGVMNVVRAQAAVEGLATYGYPAGAGVPLGVVLLASVALYVVPRTAVLGAILLTGWLGGAVSTHVRAGDAWVMAVVFGVLVWLALWLRDARVRALVPIRSVG